MAGRGRKKRSSFSTHRIRIKQQAANDRRIYKMVKKAVHQELPIQNLDVFLITKQELTFMKRLTEIQGEIIKNLKIIYDCLSKILQKIEEEGSKTEEHEGYSMPTKNKQEGRSETLLDVSDCLDTSDVSSHSETTLQLADREQDEEQQVLTNVSAPPDHLFKIQEPKHEEEEELEIPNQENELMATQWREWMDKQEERQIYVKVKPAVAQKTQKQEGGALSVLGKQVRQAEKPEGKFTKVAKILVNLFTPDSSFKYQQFEDED